MKELLEKDDLSRDLKELKENDDFTGERYFFKCCPVKDLLESDDQQNSHRAFIICVCVCV